ncbi:hypothetical protein Scel_21480 [Streptomyces cellostaticus]|nr:hypothetical protein Scel_21480 [Streptomyces cellostaticus]
MAPENRDEVRQRIDSLYDRAESETGKYNATRAMSVAARGRGVPLAKRGGRRPDPALDEVSRQWFDAARAKRGPSVPAVLPKDRQPDRPAAPARSRDRAALELGLPELAPGSAGPAAERVVPELTAGSATDLTGRPRAALEAGSTPQLPGATAKLPGLSGRGMAELPTGGMPELPGRSTTEPFTGGAPELTGPGAAEYLVRGMPDTTGFGTPEPLSTGTPQLTSPAAAEYLDLGMPDTTGLNTPEPPGAGTPQLTSPAAAEYLNPGMPDPTGLGTPEPLSTGTPQLTSPAAAQSLGVAGATGLVAAEPFVESAAGPVTPGTADSLGLGVPGLTGRGPAETAVLPVATLPAAQGVVAQQPRELPASPTAPRRPSPADSKTKNRQKLATAQELLSRYTASLGTPLTAAQATYSAQGAWDGGTGQAVQPSTEWWGQPSAEYGWQPELQQPGRLSPQQPGQPDLQQPDQLSTGQWQQPQWTAPGMQAVPSPAAPLTTAAPMTDTGSFARPVADPLTDTGSFTPVTTAVRVAKAITFARAQVGKPCVWGATGPDSYDCSSLTQGAWKAAGVTLPRAAHQQALAGTPVTLAALEPGDLVLFFDDDRHVGLHIGNGMMIHAPGPGSYIREESIYGAGESAIHRVIRPA